MGLKIDEYVPNYYRMTDDKNNALVFVNGHLLHMEDANGNLIRLYYVYSDGTSASNGYPSSSGSRITRIVQKNQAARKSRWQR